LRELGCQTAQAYLFSKAVPALPYRRYLRDGHIQIDNRSGIEITGSFPNLAAELLANAG
jgi:EAL domain-containing protein (putative c-di-GMP-specific phosphodiesterase class I)